MLALGLVGIARASPEGSRPESRRAGSFAQKEILGDRSPSVCRPEEHSSPECARSPRFFWTAIARSYAAQKAPIAQKRVSRPEDSRGDYYPKVVQKPILCRPEGNPEESRRLENCVQKTLIFFPEKWGRSLLGGPQLGPEGNSPESRRLLLAIQKNPEGSSGRSLLGSRSPVSSGPECDPEDSRKCSAPIQKGELAPYDGQVLTTELAIDLGQRAMHCEERISIENARLEALRKVDADREKAIQNAIQKIHEQQVVLLEKQLDQALSRPFWTDPVFVSSVTAVVTLGSALGIWWLAVQTVQVANSK